MSERETSLGGGWSIEGVVRVGGTVRCPPIFATQLMRDVLVHLEQVSFEAAPRWLGCWDETLVGLAAERAWFVANHAAF